MLPLFVRSYERLGVLAPLRVGGYVGRPLDRGRCGFVLGEIGAAVVLEATEGGGRPGVGGAVELVDTAVGSDGGDLIRTSGDMPGLRAVAGRLLRGRGVDLVHPHATGTLSHDPAELGALSAGLGGRASGGGPVDVYASKGAIGHGLGASGLASLVIACMCGRAGRRPPMPWLRDPIRDGEGVFSISAEGLGGAVGRQAVFAAGFGGHVAGAVIGSGG